MSHAGSDDKGSIDNLTLVLYGTTEMPAHYKKPRSYDQHYNKVQDRSAAALVW